MIDKSDVSHWLYKCKNRAVEAVNDCVSYLTNLGFDTSSLLVMPDNVNKNLLFVCNDSKP